MRKIEEYEIISEAYLENIPKRVMELIKEGWQPYNDVKKIDETYYVQVMVKYESEESDKQQLND